MQKPLPGEYNPYFQRYLALVPEENVLSALETDLAVTHDYFEALPDTLHDFRYAEGKWTVKQVLLHLTDVERVMTYRALVAARHDTDCILSPMNENVFADHADVSPRSMADLLAEFRAVRQAGLHLFKSLDKAAQTRRGTSSTGYPVTARALATMLVGHARHHINIINERYLPVPA